MKEKIELISRLLIDGQNYLTTVPESELIHKPAPGKWSKKEILGHLIDSAIHNLQRFTQIQFESRPYKIMTYNQDQLVATNDYQHARTDDLLNLWLALNIRILYLYHSQTPHSLEYELVLPDGTPANLRYLMNDYADHMAHHIRQILESGDVG